VFTASSLYGTAPNTPSAGVTAPTERMSFGDGDIAAGVKGLIDPHNPLVWFGGVLLVTVGAASVAGSVRLGRGKVAVSVGS